MTLAFQYIYDNNLMDENDLCRACGYTLAQHHSGEHWDNQIEQDAANLCQGFSPPVTRNIVALEYIGAAFLVWSAARREVQEMLWERDEMV